MLMLKIFNQEEMFQVFHWLWSHPDNDVNPLHIKSPNYPKLNCSIKGFKKEKYIPFMLKEKHGYLLKKY